MAEVTRVTVDEELRRHPEGKMEDLVALRQWLSTQPHLPQVTDMELLMFLHSCNYSVEATKHTIDMYFSVRTHTPEYFSARDPLQPDLQLAAKVTSTVMLPQATSDGYRVYLGRLIDFDATKFDLWHAFKLFLMISDLWLDKQGLFPGILMVIDMQGLTAGHVARLSVGAFRKFFLYVQEALPVRLRGLHFINGGPFMDIVMAMMRPFIKEDLRSVMYVHSITESLYEFVPQDVLPGDYGGKGPESDTLRQETVKCLQANKEWFELEATRRVDESKRPPKDNGHYEDGMGTPGSFRKLDID